MAIALQDFRVHRGKRKLRPDTTPSELPDDLAPIGRYFARRFAIARLLPSEEIVRTEFWHGIAPIPPPSQRDRQNREAHLDVLQKYFDGPVEIHGRLPDYPPYHGGERVEGIDWVLEYYE